MIESWHKIIQPFKSIYMTTWPVPVTSDLHRAFIVLHRSQQTAIKLSETDRIRSFGAVGKSLPVNDLTKSPQSLSAHIIMLTVSSKRNVKALSAQECLPGWGPVTRSRMVGGLQLQAHTSVSSIKHIINPGLH